MAWMLLGVCMLGTVVIGVWPSLQHMVLAWQVKQQAQHWLMQLESAQQQAMARSQRVTVCPTLDQQHCSGDWQHTKWVRVVAADHLMGRFERGPYLYDTNWRSNHIVFEPLGGTRGQQGRWLWGTDAYCCWQVILSHTGRLRLTYKHASLATDG